MISKTRQCDVMKQCKAEQDEKSQSRSHLLTEEIKDNSSVKAEWHQKQQTKRQFDFCFMTEPILTE